jgi:hypothetical protein
VTKQLHISADLSLPLDIVTEATAIVATRGAGKSSASAVVVEEVFALGVQVVIFDRTGVYWGLRSNARGTGPGLGVYVLGGPHGDVPLEPGAGSMVADLVVESGHSFVLDLSDFSKSATIRFAADLLERLYDRKARARATTLLVLDEAHFYAPQTPRGGFKGDSARLMGAMEDVVGLGRSRGLGAILTTQRTQALNKAILDLIETLLVMRMLSPRARDAVQDWIREKQEDDREGVLATLDSLPTGTAWVWSPLRGILERVALRRIETFDSYATPKPGETRAEPRTRKQLDLDALGEQMRTTIERAKQDDPRELRRQIAELRRELTARPAEKQIETVTERVEVEVVGEKALKRLEKATEGLAAAAAEITAALKRVSAQPGGPPPRAPSPTPPRPAPIVPSPRRAVPPAGAPDGELKLGRAHRAILSVLAQREGLVTSKRQLAVMTGYSIKGGGFNNPLGALRSAGLLEGTDPIAITAAGREAIDAVGWSPLPTGPALLDHWTGQLGKAHGLILRALAGVYPASLSKQELADATGYEASGGGFNNPLGKLRTLELIEGSGELRLTDSFGEQVTGA